MNLLHRLVCRSALWRWMVERWVIPWALDGLDLGEDVLELGPGPGLTTDVLRERAARLTAVEIDPRLASSLQERMKNTNVEVAEVDATAMPFPDGSFSAVLSFTMLHHVPSVTAGSPRPLFVPTFSDALENEQRRAAGAPTEQFYTFHAPSPPPGRGPGIPRSPFG